MSSRYPVKIYEEDFYKSNKLWLIAYISDNCNLECKYCYNFQPRTNKLLDLDVLLKFITDIYIKTSCNIELKLIGGEPTTHPKLLDFCKQLSLLKFVECEIFTNFTADVELYKQLTFLGNRLFVSWHGKYKDNFVEKAKTIGDNNAVYCVMFENDNWSSSKAMFDKLIELYPNSVESSLIGSTDLEYEYTEEQLREYNDVAARISKYKGRYTVEFNDGTVEKKSFNDLYLNNLYCFKTWKCDAGKRHLYVHSNGNVYQCQSYYDCKALAMTNMYKDNCIDEIKFKPVVCKFPVCSCTYNIKKEKLTR